MSTDVRIDHDTFVFTFIGANEISRAALFTEDMELIEHYVFPAISGGKVMTVKPAGAAPKPDGTAAETIGTPAIGGNDKRLMQILTVLPISSHSPVVMLRLLYMPGVLPAI